MSVVLEDWHTLAVSPDLCAKAASPVAVQFEDVDSSAVRKSAPLSIYVKTKLVLSPGAILPMLNTIPIAQSHVVEPA